MKLYRHTEVVSIETEQELDLLIKTLQQMKQAAPRSLKMQLAVTVERTLHDVRPVALLTGSPIPVHPGLALRQAARTLEEGQRVTQVVQEVVPPEPSLPTSAKKGRHRRSAFAVED